MDRNSKSEFERHVEPRASIRAGRHLYRRDVVDRIPTRTNQLTKALESVGVDRNFENSAGIETKTGQGRDQCEVQILSTPIEREVQKYVVSVSAAGHPSASG